MAKTCETERGCARRYGVNGRRVQRRLVELRAADVLGDLGRAPGGLHPLKGDRKGQFAMALLEPFRLIIEPSDEPLPLRDDGSLDMQSVRSVRILEVTDYHDR